MLVVTVVLFESAVLSEAYVRKPYHLASSSARWVGLISGSLCFSSSFRNGRSPVDKEIERVNIGILSMAPLSPITADEGMLFYRTLNRGV